MKSNLSDGLQSDRNQDKLAAEAEKQVQGNGLTDEQLKIYSTIGGTDK